MSKHKHFHRIKGGVQMLQHGRREGIGPFSRQLYKRKAAADAANTDGGQAERDLQNHVSASSLPDNGEENQV